MSNITAAGFAGTSIPAIQLGTSQDLPYNPEGGQITLSQPFGASTTLIQVAAHIRGIGVRIAIGDPTTLVSVASQSSTLLPGSGIYAFCVHPGWVLSAVSDDGHQGYINITEAATLG